MIDLETEPLISLKEAQRLPFLKGRGGNQISLDSLNRWRLEGLRGITLETVRIGGAVRTSAAAVIRFIDRLNAQEQQSVRPSSQRRREIEEANQRCDAIGIK